MYMSTENLRGKGTPQFKQEHGLSSFLMYILLHRANPGNHRRFSDDPHHHSNPNSVILNMLETPNPVPFGCNLALSNVVFLFSRIEGLKIVAYVPLQPALPAVRVQDLGFRVNRPLKRCSWLPVEVVFHCSAETVLVKVTRR